MNEIVSFTKEIEFNTSIDKIESISIEHTLNLDGDSSVKGDLIISGTYKITPVTLIDSPFSYKVPVDIVMDSKYDLSNMTIDIDNFTYDVIDNNKLSINVDLILENLFKKEEQEEIIDVNDLFLEKEEPQKIEVPVLEKDEVNEQINENDSLFSNFSSSSETYSTYSVYVMNENDSLDSIMDKYKVSRKDLEEYNNLNELKNGTKIIIPSSNE